MSFTSLMDKQLLKAFKQLKDLTVYATFNEVSATKFDFGNLQAKTTKAGQKVVPIVVVETKKVKGDSKTTVKTVLARTADLGSLSDYESLVFENRTWKMGTIMKGSGPMLMFEVMSNG
jgi:hypothetical protein